MSTIVSSSGHSLYVRGASRYLDEVNEARKVVTQVSKYLKQLVTTTYEYHDNTSRTQRDNINNIIKYHNSKYRDLDVSYHFNAASVTDAPRGVEVLYYSDSQRALAERVSKAIADASGLKNRGAKKRDNLGFLKGSNKPAILIEVCFVDSKADAEIYKAKFDESCKAIAESLTGKKVSSSSDNTIVQPPKTTPIPSPTTNNPKDGVCMYKPSNSEFVNATSRVLTRLSNTEVHGDKAITTTHRDKLLKGELSLDDSIALLFVALDRGMIRGDGKVDDMQNETMRNLVERIEELEKLQK